MTNKQCIKTYLEFLKEISRQGYSRDLMQIASDMFVVIPKESMEKAMKEFTQIAKKGLPEREFHYEISQVFKEIMGYNRTPAETL